MLIYALFNNIKVDIAEHFHFFAFQKDIYIK